MCEPKMVVEVCISCPVLYATVNDLINSEALEKETIALL